MKYFAANAVPIGANYSAQATFPPSGWWQEPFNKLDAFVNLTDAVVQFLNDQSGWEQDQSQEMLLRQGFNGRDPLPPFYAVRFKVWTGTLLAASGTVDIAALVV